MIAPDDRVTIAPGVRVEEDFVVDEARALRLPANTTAVHVLAFADGRTVADIGASLQLRGASDGLRDALEFCAELNRRLLVNVRARRGSLLRRRIVAARFGVVVRAHPRRVRGTLRGVAPCAIGVSLLVLPATLLVHAWLLAPATGAGMLLHELGHASALRRVPHVVVRRGLQPALLHPRLRSPRLLAVAVAGPLAPSLAALGGCVLWHGVAVICTPLAAHALALTVVAPDGRNACGLS